MTVPRARLQPVRRLRAGALALSLLLGASVLFGCTSPQPTSTPTPTDSGSMTAPPTASAPPASAPPASAPPASAPVPSQAVFAWAAKPEAFDGGVGSTLATVTAGPAGLVALSVRDGADGTRTTRLWGSADGVAWQSITPTGVPDHVIISGVWGAADRYWLRASLLESDDPGTLYRSTDGLAWNESLAITEGFGVNAVVDGCEASTPSHDACPIFLTGSRGVDGEIWRSMDGGDSWSEAKVEDATGWMGEQDAAPVEILGVAATSDALLAFGNGLPHASDTSGVLQARFWRSADDGATWSRIAHAAPLGEIYVRDVLAGDEVVVAVGDAARTEIATALASVDGGRTWSLSATSGARAEGSLGHVLSGTAGFIGLGFASPALVDSFPLGQFAWTSQDGASWRTGPPGDLEGGIVDDAVRFGEMIVAVGRAWTTDATGTWEAPFGPAVWTLKP